MLKNILERINFHSLRKQGLAYLPQVFYGFLLPKLIYKYPKLINLIPNFDRANDTSLLGALKATKYKNYDFINLDQIEGFDTKEIIESMKFDRVLLNFDEIKWDSIINSKTILSSKSSIKDNEDLQLVLRKGNVFLRRLYKLRKNFNSALFNYEYLNKLGVALQIHEYDAQNKAIYLSIPDSLSNSKKSFNKSSTLKLLETCHFHGIANINISEENLFAIESGSQFLIKVDSCIIFKSRGSILYNFERNRDRESFNKIYNSQIFTESIARNEFESAKESFFLSKQNNQYTGDKWYTTIDFGQGFNIGNPWVLSHGPGRWSYLNSKVVPNLVEGKNVLDLGSNVGIFPIYMAKSGAKSVTCVEIDGANNEIAKTIQNIFEWRNQEIYKIERITDNMTVVLNEDFEKFDVITAFCSLYYLDYDLMKQVIFKCSQLSDVIILQSNEQSQPDGRKDRANAVFLKKMLIENGFQDTQIFDKDNFDRKILIGYRRK